MNFKLKFGPNFSLSDGNQTFSITDTKSKGVIEVVANGETDGIFISGYQFLLTHNGTPLRPQGKNKNPKLEIDFKNKQGNWNVEVLVDVIEQDFDDTTRQQYKVPGTWKVIDNSGGNTTTVGSQGQVSTDIPNKIYTKFRSIITDVIPEQRTIITKKALSDDLNSKLSPKTYEQSLNWAIKQNKADYKNLDTLIDFGNNQKSVIVNSQVDAETIKIEPYSVVLKTYNNIPNDVQIKQNVSIVQEIAEPIRETIRVYPFNKAELGDPILRQPTKQSKDFINNAKTQEKSLDDLYTNDTFLSSSLFNEILSGSNQADINVDFNDYGIYSTFG